jgi:hypothetical protein
MKADPWAEMREEIEGTDGLLGGIYFPEDDRVDAAIAKQLLIDADALLLVVRAAQDDGITHGNVQALGKLRKALRDLPEHLKGLER